MATNRYDRVFTDAISSFIFNRLDIEPKDSVIAREVMARFPVWVKAYTVDTEFQVDFIKWLIHGMRIAYKLGRQEIKESDAWDTLKTNG